MHCNALFPKKRAFYFRSNFLNNVKEEFYLQRIIAFISINNFKSSACANDGTSNLLNRVSKNIVNNIRPSTDPRIILNHP